MIAPISRPATGNKCMAFATLFKSLMYDFGPGIIVKNAIVACIDLISKDHRPPT